MTDEQIEKALECCSCGNKQGCSACSANRNKNQVHSCTIHVSKDALSYINRLKSEKQLAEIQLKDLLSALYKTSGENGFTIYRNDVVEIAKDYRFKEEELK